MAKRLSIFIVMGLILMSFSGLTLTTQAALSGAGTDSDPYLITSAADFVAITDLTAVYAVTADFTEAVTATLGGFSGKLIGCSADGTTEEMRTVKVNISSSGTAETGLFTILNSGAEIRNITLEGSVTAASATNVGGFAGKTASGAKVSLTNCVNKAAVTGKVSVGGIIGRAYDTCADVVLKNLLNYGVIVGKNTGDSNVGGIVGLAGTMNEPVSTCANIGSVTSAGNRVGGIIGWSYAKASNCFNSGSVSGGNKVGGIAGETGNANQIDNSYNCAQITASNGYAGGIVGYGSANQYVKFCYNTGEITGTTAKPIGNYGVATTSMQYNYYLSANPESDDDGMNNTTPLSGEAMTKAESFKGFDFENVWTLAESSADSYAYPQLKDNLHIILWGTEEHPYIVDSPEDFDNIRKDSSACYSLTANITLPDDYVPFSFSGKLIGSDPSNLKSITVNIQKAGVNSVGLFSTVTGTAVIRNIELKGSVLGGNFVGGFVGGDNQSTTSTAVGAAIENCVNRASVTGVSNVGGFAGRLYNGTQYLALNNLKNYGDIRATSANSYAGGIIGSSGSNVTVTNCANFVTISGNKIVGGINGWCYISISGCYNSGTISGTDSVGGIVGQLTQNGKSITNCYNSGSIECEAASGSAGGICGNVNNGSAAQPTRIENCYNTFIGGAPFSPVYGTLTSGKTLTVSNCYYLSSSALDDGKEGTAAKKRDELAGLAGTLGSAFTAPAGEYQFPEISGNLNTSGYKIYIVTATAGSNGTITPSGEQYIKGGETFTVTVTPEEGYAVGYVKYNNTPVDVTAEGTYTTPKLTADASIDAAFVPVQTEKEVIPVSNIFTGTENGISFRTAFATVSLDSTLQEYGILFCETNLEPEAFVKDAEGVFAGKAVTAANGKGQYGIKFTGNLKSGTYYTRAYAVYGENTVYGDVIIPVMIP